MSAHLQTRNGIVAKIWLLQSVDDLKNTTANTFFDPFLTDHEPIAEVREVIHQKLGQLRYFTIELKDKNENNLFIRGYCDKTTLLLVDECSSYALQELGIDTLCALKKSLHTVVESMTPNLPGQFSIRSHLNNNSPKILELESLQDWDTLRGIVMNSKASEKLSYGFLDQLDLHPNLTDIETNEKNI